MAEADCPDGPWRALGRPVLEPGEQEDWDCSCIHDPFPLVYKGNIYLYYKGSPGKRRGGDNIIRAQGVAIAEHPAGPFEKSPLNPVLNAGHETCLWPYKTGIAALVSLDGPEKNTVQYAPDGVNFTMMSLLQVPPIAPGPFVPDAFADNGDGRGITWGLCHINPDGGGAMNESVLARFDCDLSRDVDRPLFKHNNLRFDERTYFQRVLALPAYMRQRILKERDRLDKDTVAGGTPGRNAFLRNRQSNRSVAQAAEVSRLADNFQWTTGPPVVRAVSAGGEDWISVKDPSLVRYDGRWHLFCTVRGSERSHAIVYLSFSEWGQASKAQQHVLSCHGGYFCAPQVFYFMPHKKWYMICQASDDSWEPKYRPAYSTSQDISDPDSWSTLKPLVREKPAGAKAWLDFWVICDSAKAHLFFTSLDGKMWRAQTALADFPRGWSQPAVALRGDVFEASHTYRLKGSGKYLTLIEAQHGHGWRYYKAYLADRLDGRWEPLAAEKDNAFASMRNVRQTDERWTDSISHGELIRAGYDEQLQVDPADLRFLFQGVTDRQRSQKSYGKIPWRLGILELER